MGFGDYPAAYNAEVHGPYDPARYYGKGMSSFELPVTVNIVDQLLIFGA